jgi:hypothetical protein
MSCLKARTSRADRAFGAPASGDELLIYDADAAAEKKITAAICFQT